MCQLGFLSALRGTDSTGIAVGYRKKDKGKFGVYTHKSLQASPDFFASKDAQAILSTPMFCLIGHTRAATIGDVTLDNAHPHTSQHITGTHNGTISGLGVAGRSDSSILFERVAEHGVAKGFGMADHGAYATVFADVRARTVNFFRNTQRPLYLMWDKGKQLLLWASEKEMLTLVAARTGSIASFNDPFLLREHVLYSIPFGSTQPTVNEIKLIRPAPTVLVNRFHAASRQVDSCASPAWVSAIRNGVDNTGRSLDTSGRADSWEEFWGDVDPNEDTTSTPVPTTPVLGGSALLPKSVPLPSVPAVPSPKLHKFEDGARYDEKYYQANPRLIIPTEDAELVLAVGCSGCGESKTLDDNTEWTDHETFLCEDCQDSEFAKIYAGGDRRHGTLVHCG